MTYDLDVWAHFIGQAGIWGWLGLAIVLSALFVSGGAVVASPALFGRRRVVLLASSTSLTLGAIVGLTSVAGVFRERSLGIILGTVESGWFGLGFSLVEEQLSLTLLPPLLVLALPLTIVAVARAAGTDGSLGYAAAFVVFVAGVCASLEIAAVWDVFGDPFAADGMRGRIACASAWIDLAPVVISAAAVLGSSCVLVARRRNRRRFSRGMNSGAVLVFLVGALAFAASRGHAHDRHHRVSLMDEWPRMMGEVRPLPHWMESGRCEPLESAPLLVLMPGRQARIDGQLMELDGAVTHLVVLRHNWRILHPRVPFPGVIAVAPHAEMRSHELMTWASSIGDAGYVDLRIVFTTSERRATRTLGDVDTARFCTLPMALPYAAGARDTPSVEELIRAAYRARLSTKPLDRGCLGAL